MMSAQHDTGLSFLMPSNPTPSMSQLQALHGNEAKVVVLSYPNPSAGYETPHAYTWRGTMKQIVMHLLRWNGALALFVYVSVL
jgi:hypothetical protein